MASCGFAPLAACAGKVAGFAATVTPGLAGATSSFVHTFFGFALAVLEEVAALEEESVGCCPAANAAHPTKSHDEKTIQKGRRHRHIRAETSGIKGAPLLN
jgi:hypothetical protein